ncbi:unnamed protein product [Polarella glacialis]|uniref:Uncharacterized protein n=2 Tax=Polarella glacialis TaxID=89957 RepID=A0A813IAH0_POLGL|nr:unnamed protein product [Polarella glacialis]
MCQSLQKLDVTATSGNSVDLFCRPWSEPLQPWVRENPTTLTMEMRKLPQGLCKAQQRLDARRYQPSYADHGLSWRLRDTPLASTEDTRGPGGSSSSQCRSEGKTPKQSSRPKVGALAASAAPELSSHQSVGAATLTPSKQKYPIWWGNGGLAPEEDRPTYEDLGSWYVRGKESNKNLSRTRSLPLVHGKYTHENNFLSQFPYSRGPGGVVVCDISVAPKP